MPYTVPLRRVRPDSENPSRQSTRPPSPPSRNPSTTSSNTVSSTSSLEAAPMRPPSSNVTAIASGDGRFGTGSAGYGSQAGSGGGNYYQDGVSLSDDRAGRASKAGPSESSRENETEGDPNSRQSRDDEESGQDGLHDLTNSNTYSRNRRPISSTRTDASVSPQTPRAPMGLFPGASPDFGYNDRARSMATASPIPAHLIPIELRPSSTGPDLASLRAQANARAQAKAQRSSSEQRLDRHDDDANADGDGDGEEDFDDPGSLSGRKGKVRSASSPAEVQPQIHSSSAAGGRTDGDVIIGEAVSKAYAAKALRGGTATGTNTPAHYPHGATGDSAIRRGVGLQDFIFGEVIGQGSYSTVVLAQHKATNVPYAIKILDQHQLVQQRKAKYAKVERDALVLLGPRLPPPKTSPASRQRRRKGDGGSGEDGRRGSTASLGPYPGRYAPTTEQRSRSRPSTSQGKFIISRAPSTVPPETEEGVERLASSTPSLRIDTSAQGLEAPSHSQPQPQRTSNNGLMPPSPTSRVTGGHRQSSSLADSVSSLALSPDSASSSMELPPLVKRKVRHSHPGIVKLHWTFKDDTSLYFVLDLAINGDLLGLIRKHGSLNLESCRRYAAQIIDTVQFMHERGVIHRDLKPENILLDDDLRVKITDFGSARIMRSDDDDVKTTQEERKRSFVGTAEYVSPEVLRNEHASHPADVWAFGCILFQMVAGRPPFRGATEYLTFQKVLNRECEFPEGYDEVAKDLTEQILKLDPQKRLSVDRIKAHPFFATIDFDTLWTDRQPDVRTGIAGPESSGGRNQVPEERWDELFGTPVEDVPFAGGFEDRGHEEDDETVLGAPKRHWVEHGGALGTFSSGSAPTEDGGSSHRFYRGDEAADGKYGNGRKRDSTAGSPRSSVSRRPTSQWLAEDKAEAWATLLLPEEQVKYTSPVLARSRVMAMPKRRTLVLTNQRLICAKEEPTKIVIKIKGESFLSQSTLNETQRLDGTGSDNSNSNGRRAEEASVIDQVNSKGARAFVVKVRVGSKISRTDYTYICDREDIRDRWIKEINEARLE